jgi:hypothetical protein
VHATADYDATRQNETQDTDDDSVQMIKALHGDVHSEAIDADDAAPYEAMQLLVAELSNLQPGQEPTVPVVPMQADEFTCGRCFLIHPQSRLGRNEHGQPVCRDCG